ncbi:MAG: prephenate dehydrogenase/arogenate dehydrogenase family protein [Betaproteobacteria bacterium]|nr:prephenate dehydrogenase/arogenate dehydrogenase family protein [Betaproteobacteria bacterium]
MSSKLRIGKLVVIGVGLIGGSFAASLKRANIVERVVGVGRTRRNLAAALRAGIIDEIVADAGRAVRDADLVFIGTPVGQTAAVMARIAPHLPPHAVTTDGGSTKQDVIAHARRLLGGHFARFVPAHPIAGAEKSGASAATGELFHGRTVILVPQPGTAPRAVRLVRSAWEQCGAHVTRLGAREHDEIFAAVSHLPHVVAYALVSALARRRNGRELFGVAGAGLRDTVRIAGSSPEMWRDICLANRTALLTWIDRYLTELKIARRAIRRGDGATLGSIFERARASRAKWLLKAKS